MRSTALERTFQALALIGGCVALLPHAASAAPQTTYMTTYLRAGPGYQFYALDEVEPHTVVDVLGCDKGWCRVSFNRASGYIQADVLSGPDIHAKPPMPESGAACFTAMRNGRPRGGDEIRVCNNK